MTFNLDSTSPTPFTLVCIDPTYFTCVQPLNGDPFVQIDLVNGVFGDHLCLQSIIFQVGNTRLVECFNPIDVERTIDFGRNIVKITFEQITVTDIKNTI